MSEKNFYSFYKLNDEETNKLKEEVSVPEQDITSAPAQHKKIQHVYELVEDDEEEKKRPSLVAFVLIVIVVVGFLVAMIISGFNKDDVQTDDLKMPDFYGMDYNYAVGQYGNNIKFEFDGSDYNELDEGLICSQDIESGTKFKKGDVLKVRISKGMETIKVPNVANMNAELAKDKLKEYGLEYEVKNSSSTEVQKGYVISTEPEVDTEVHKGATILLYVSMGAGDGQVIVDDYIGMLAEDAEILAEYAGLKPMTELKASYDEEGKVIEQSISKGTEVDEGTEIIFFVSNGIAPDGEMPFTVPFPEKASGKFVIDFVITNEDGTTSTESTDTLIIPEMTRVTQNVKGSGENVSVTVILTNLNTSEKSQIGEYILNFATGEVAKVLYEDINEAFESVGGFDNETSTETTTKAPTGHIESKETQALTKYVEPETQAPTKYIEPETQAPTKNVESEQITTINSFDPSLVGVFDRDAGDGLGYFDIYGNYYPYNY